MTLKIHPFIERLGYFMLLMAAIFLLLFLANLRSRLYYYGPNYSFLLLIFLYCAVTGFGLLWLRRWAVLSLFVPGVLSASILIYGGVAKGAYVPMPWALVNMGFVLLLLGIPALILRYWSERRW